MPIRLKILLWFTAPRHAAADHDINFAATEQPKEIRWQARLGISLTYDMVVKGRGGLWLLTLKMGQFTKFIVTLPLS